MIELSRKERAVRFVVYLTLYSPASLVKAQACTPHTDGHTE